MKRFETISVNNLIVNPENDRHGALGTEENAINWLLQNKTEKMRALAKDIAITGQLFETPLVKDERKEKYVVYDGNRRITCLKILSGLCDSYDLFDRDFYVKIRNDYNCYDRLPKEIICEVNTEQNEIDEIIRRRHAPTNSGEIKLNWEPYEKETFLIRTGKSDKINFAKEIQDLLQGENLLSNQDKIPLSNFNRLFSSEKYRNLSGVSIKNNKIEFIAKEDVSLNALSYIARLMIAGEISLKDILNDELKMEVFAYLQNKGILPTLSDRLKKPITSSTKRPSQTKIKPQKIAGELTRDTLLSKSLIQPQRNQYCTAKIYNLFIELQYDLLIRKHINAISISFRVLIELLTQAYANKHTIIFGEKEKKLSNKIGRVFDHIQSPKKDTENVKFIKNLSQTNTYFSIGTLNGFVHSSTNLPVAQDLINFADNFESYMTLIIEDLNEGKNE